MIHTHIQLIHKKYKKGQYFIIFITKIIPSHQIYTLCRKNTYDNHRTCYLYYINPHSYNMLHNAPFLKTHTYDRHKTIFKALQKYNDLSVS
jgi:hypothetical protein